MNGEFMVKINSLPKDGIIMVSNQEPLIFRRRAGYATVNDTEVYNSEHSEEKIKRLKDLGITIVRTHFYKGFGLKTEAEEINITKEFVQLLHKYGIKVQGYTQFGTFQYETLLLEEPEAVQWASINYRNEEVKLSYDYQLFRYLPCFNQEGYLKYLEKVIRVGIEEVGLDMLGFDNIRQGMEPDSCHCKECKKKFIEFLTKKYKLNTEEGKNLAKKRFGFSDLRYIKPPYWNVWNLPGNYYQILDPAIQEWIDFRCETLRKAFERLYKFAKSIKNDIILEYNVYPFWGENCMFLEGKDLYRLGRFMDGFYNEHDPFPEVTKDKRILSRIRSFKLGRAMGNFMISVNNNSSDAHLKLSLAENLAFNEGNIGVFGHILEIGQWNNSIIKKYIKFRKKNCDLYLNTHSLSKIGVLESYFSLAYNKVNPHYSNIAIIQTLISERIPFDIVLDVHLENLSKYSLLILPDVECLSDEQKDNILKFVKKGGKLIVTENSGMYNEWYRKREKNIFSEISKESCYVIKEIKHKLPFSYSKEDWCVVPKYWALPLNYKEIVKAVKSLIGKENLVEVKASYGCVIELLGNKDKTILHLLNCNINKPLNNIKISIMCKEKDIKNVKILSPDELNDRKVNFKIKDNKISFTIKKLNTYKICIFE